MTVSALTLVDFIFFISMILLIILVLIKKLVSLLLKKKKNYFATIKKMGLNGYIQFINVI